MIFLEIIGNLTADPTTGQTASGSKFTNFTIAARTRDKGENGENTTEFVRASAFGMTAEICAKSLRKGDKVYARGDMVARRFKNRSGVDVVQIEIRNASVEFLSQKHGDPQKDAPPIKETQIQETKEEEDEFPV